MKTFFRLSIFPIIASALVIVAQHQHQPHSQSSNAAQQMNKIKTLTNAEVENYLNGRGMGLAKAAELNSYPGPMHVLQLAEPLGLTAHQRRATQRAFERMRAGAVRLYAEHTKKWIACGEWQKPDREGGRCEPRDDALPHGRASAT